MQSVWALTCACSGVCHQLRTVHIHIYLHAGLYVYIFTLHVCMACIHADIPDKYAWHTCVSVLCVFVCVCSEHAYIHLRHTCKLCNHTGMHEDSILKNAFTNPVGSSKLLLASLLLLSALFPLLGCLFLCTPQYNTEPQRYDVLSD